MAPNYLALLPLIFDKNVSKKLVLQMVFKQIGKIGYAKVLAVILSASMIGVSSFIRIPQIQKIINPKLLEDRIKVAQGLSLESYSIESLNYLIHVVFNYQNKNSFINYGESLLLGIQNIAIILLIKFYRLRASGEIPDLSDKSSVEKLTILREKLALPIGGIVGSIIVLSLFAPPEVISTLQVLNIPINIISKLPQINQNRTLKTASHLSVVTLRANVLGSLIRVFTSGQDVLSKRTKGKAIWSDYILWAGYFTSLALNGTLLGQSIFYDGCPLLSKKQYPESSEKEQEKKKDI
ncbi:uncharacterized protein RJT21DRAFT_123025 [Scheffersomyces amazonensis]|uniref:uncharacterized protein n=1 Tax=Scheffersomyces amazonensis TaxID=1078765 RepID=UPI00315DF5A2